MRRLVIAFIGLFLLTGCVPKQDNGNLPEPPGSTEYIFIVKTYERTRFGESIESSRRVNVVVDAIDTEGGHGTYDVTRDDGKKVTGPYPYKYPEQTPWDHDIGVGGPEDPRSVITGELSATLAAAGYGNKILCRVTRNGVTVAEDSEENLSESIVDIDCEVRF